jgi:nitrogen regulatory protein P-II 1
MKRIDAVIRPERLEQVKALLSEFDIQGATAAEVRGFGRQRGHTEMYRGTEYSVDFLPKILLTIIALDESVPKIVDAIIKGGRTGKMGDGKIFVTPVDEAIRIRTGERGPAAL